MTKRADQLLQKANVYEKLALFGSRKNFLTAIAQEAMETTSFPSQQVVEALRPVEAKLTSVVSTVSQELAQSGQAMSNLQQAASTLSGLMQPSYVSSLNELKSKSEALATQIMNVRTSTYSLAQAKEIKPETKAYLTQLSGEASQAYDVLMRDPNVAKVMGEQPSDNIAAPTNNTPPAHNAATIPVATQNALSSIMVGLNQGIPVSPTGKLDKATQWALNKYKQLLGSSASSLQGKALYDKIQDSFMYVHLMEKAGKSPEEILKGLQSGGTAAQARQQADLTDEQNQGRNPNGVRPFPTQ